MWRMIRFEAEVAASVGGCSVNASGISRPFPHDQNRIMLFDYISIVNCMERKLKGNSVA
jgi:hypothetical protein